MKLLRLALLALFLACSSSARAQQNAPRPLFGALQPKPENIASNFRAGLRVAILEVGWDRFEPRDDEWSLEYIEDSKRRLSELRAGGMKVMLDLGMQYPPRWAHDLAGARYWAFDDLAQGRAPGLPVGIAPCPVPGWKPGGASENHESARRFLDWYLGALHNYHDWQIEITRRYFDGPLAMLYPSWGIRPGQAEAAVKGDLSGATSPEKNGEIQRGFDFARFIGGVRDPKLIAYCTWLDSNPEWSDEASTDRARWSPAHFLSTLAREHPLKLRVWGENTGGGGMIALERSLARTREFDLDGLMWAFEPDLYDREPPTIDDFMRLIAPAK